MLPDGPLKQHLVLNSVRLTTWEALKAKIDNIRRTGGCQLNTAAHVPISVWYPGTRCLPEGATEVARKEQRQKQPKDDVPNTPISHLNKDWPLEARLLVQ